MTVRPIPEGYHTVTPYILADGAAALIDFLARALGAVEVSRSSSAAGAVLNAELRIGDSMVMIADARAEWPPTAVMLYVYVENVDRAYERAIAAGGVSLMAPTDQFYGDRNAAVVDPAGNSWWLATHVEDVTPEEIARRVAARERT